MEEATEDEASTVVTDIIKKHSPIGECFLVNNYLLSIFFCNSYEPP